MNDKASTTLLPCPFCGSHNVDPEGWLGSVEANRLDLRRGPECMGCGAAAKTVKLWNQRSSLA